MSKHYSLTAIIEREGKQYVSLCPELDIASQGTSIEKAIDNLKEAVELFFETASKIFRYEFSSVFDKGMKGSFSSPLITG